MFFVMKVDVGPVHNFSNESPDYSLVNKADKVNSASESEPVIPVLHAYALIVFVTSLINLLVIFRVLVNAKLSRLKRQKSISLLVAHLAAVSICHAMITLFNTSDVPQFINVVGAWCSFIGYLKSLFLSTFSMNIAMIFYERFRSFQEDSAKSFIIRMVSIIWLVPALFSLPTAEMVKPKSIFIGVNANENNSEHTVTGNCKSILLFESNAATVAYEFLRFVLFHLIVAIYMIFVLIKVRSKLRLFRQTSRATSENIKRKLRSVRLIYFHFISFVFLWLPTGFFIFFRRVLKRTTDITTEYRIAIVHEFLLSASFLYFMLNPLMSLLLIERTCSCQKSFNCCCVLFNEYRCLIRSECFDFEVNRSSQNEDDGLTMLKTMARSESKKGLERKLRESCVLGESSRFSTFGATVTTKKHGDDTDSDLEHAVAEVTV